MVTPFGESFRKSECMIEIKVIMNSSIEEVLSFKCCNLHDQNLEIHLKNRGQEPVTVPSACRLVSDKDSYLLDTLVPAGGLTIMPGEAQACYSSLEEDQYLKFQWIIFEDSQGNEYRAPLPAPQ